MGTMSCHGHQALHMGSDDTRQGKRRNRKNAQKGEPKAAAQGHGGGAQGLQSLAPEAVEAGQGSGASAVAGAGEGAAGGGAGMCERQDFSDLKALEQQLKAATEGDPAALEQLQSRVWELARDKDGCRLIQKALEVLPQADGAKLVTKLKGHVAEAVTCPNANYVIQKVIQSMHAGVSGFIVEELKQSGVKTAKHRFGCRIICRLVENSAADGKTAALVDEIVKDAGDLSRHTFGHHTIQSILEHGNTRQQHAIISTIRIENELMKNATHRSASYVVEKALQHGPLSDRKMLAEDLTNDPSRMKDLAMNQFGCYVTRALLNIDLPAPAPQDKTIPEKVRAHLSKIVADLSTTKWGPKLMEDEDIVDPAA